MAFRPTFDCNGVIVGGLNVTSNKSGNAMRRHRLSLISLTSRKVLFQSRDLSWMLTLSSGTMGTMLQRNVKHLAVPVSQSCKTSTVQAWHKFTVASVNVQHQSSFIDIQTFILNSLSLKPTKMTTFSSFPVVGFLTSCDLITYSLLTLLLTADSSVTSGGTMAVGATGGDVAPGRFWKCNASLWTRCCPATKDCILVPFARSFLHTLLWLSLHFLTKSIHQLQCQTPNKQTLHKQANNVVEQLKWDLQLKSTTSWRKAKQEYYS